jgi:hypothetical protein
MEWVFSLFWTTAEHYVSTASEHTHAETRANQFLQALVKNENFTTSHFINFKLFLKNEYSASLTKALNILLLFSMSYVVEAVLK